MRTLERIMILVGNDQLNLVLTEMERDAVLSHGAAAVTQERLCLSSDAYKTVFCATCGTIAISDQQFGTYLCKSCGDKATFGTCTIPYAYKTFIQQLAGAGLRLTVGGTLREKKE